MMAVWVCRVQVLEIPQGSKTWQVDGHDASTVLHGNTSVKNVSPSGDFRSLCWHEDLSKAELTDVEVVVIDQGEQTRGPSLKNIWLMPQIQLLLFKTIICIFNGYFCKNEDKRNLWYDCFYWLQLGPDPPYRLTTVRWGIVVYFITFLCHFLLHEWNGYNYVYKIQFKQGSVSRGSLRFVATNKQSAGFLVFSYTKISTSTKYLYIYLHIYMTCYSTMNIHKKAV